MEKIIDFANVEKLRDFSKTFSELEGSYLFGHITPGSVGLGELIGSNPLKLNGTFVMLLRDGTPFPITVNQDEMMLYPGMILTAFSNHMLQLDNSVPSDIDAYVMYFDNHFLQSVNISLTAVSLPTVVEKPSPVWKLSDEESRLIVKYFELLYYNTLDHTNIQINKQIAVNMIAAMFYQMVQFYHKRLEGEFSNQLDQRSTSRRHDYVRQFIRLVHVHYTRERSVSFYSDRLFISPKYLSMLVKEATGRSAAKWIDDFVLTEAKNMLKFSGKNIQQVAYALNFPTQSSFGKYFKHLTGMSPTEYQKS